MGKGDRILIGAIGHERILGFPTATLNRLWEKRFLDLKKLMAERHGIRLYGIKLDTIVGSPDHRDFGRYASEKGLSVPLGQQVRFVLSDARWDAIPDRDPSSPLLIAIELGSGPAAPVPHPLDEAVALAKVEHAQLVNSVADFVLDFSFCHSYLQSQLIKAICKKIGGHVEFFRRKVAFARRQGADIPERLPYVSFSSLARRGETFGTQTHAANFVHLWDGFLCELVAEAEIDRSILFWLLQNYPSFKRQISPGYLAGVVEAARPGIHYLVVQRGTHLKAKPAFRNKIDSAFSSLDMRGNGGKKFGISYGPTLSEGLVELVRSEAAYVTRLYIGGKA